MLRYVRHGEEQIQLAVSRDTVLSLSFRPMSVNLVICTCPENGNECNFITFSMIRCDINNDNILLMAIIKIDITMLYNHCRSQYALEFFLLYIFLSFFFKT